MTVVLETQRLLLRQFTTDDAALIWQLNLDPEVTRYTHDPVRDIVHADEILEKAILPQYALYNHGRWAVHTKKDLQFIGWCGLKFRPELDEIDLGYRFMKVFWGQGYATEAAFNCIHYGFEKINIQRIVGRAEPQNIGSIKVLEKCNMQFIGQDIIDEHLANTYEILNPFIR